MDNTDHFTNENSKINYILGRIGKPTSDDLLPFVHSEHGSTPIYTTAEEVLHHLELYYRNPNARDEAHEKYKKLSMSNEAVFQNFRLEFVKLAGLSGVARSEFKRDLNDKIPLRLNERVVEKFHDDLVTFEQFCELLIKYDNQQHKNFIKRSAKKDTNEKNNQSKARGDKNNSTSDRSSTGATSFSPAARLFAGTFDFGSRVLGTTTNGTKLFKSPKDVEDRKRLITEGRCFTCHETGHRSLECPHKEDATKMDTARVNAILAKTMSNKEKLDQAVAVEQSEN